MQSYLGGRAECHIRKCEVPVVPVDFMSQYTSVNELLGNWPILTAADISFQDATKSVRKLLKGITLDRCFDRRLWSRFKFFALVRPNDDILPVRTLYNGVTQNIGINHLTSDEPIWFAGPDLIAAILLSGGKVPHIEKAYCLVSRGKQDGLGTTNLRSLVEVDANKDSLFKHVIEQRADAEQIVGLRQEHRALDRFHLLDRGAPAGGVDNRQVGSQFARAPGVTFNQTVPGHAHV